MSTNNTHPAVAKFRQEGVHEWQSEEGQTDATCLAIILDAQVEATLALAYEQETANLISYLALITDFGLGELPTPDGQKLANRIREGIEERLGLA